MCRNQDRWSPLLSLWIKSRRGDDNLFQGVNCRVEHGWRQQLPSLVMAGSEKSVWIKWESFSCSASSWNCSRSKRNTWSLTASWSKETRDLPTLPNEGLHSMSMPITWPACNTSERHSLLRLVSTGKWSGPNCSVSSGEALFQTELFYMEESHCFGRMSIWDPILEWQLPVHLPIWASP